MSFKDQINKFVGKVRISDIENAFNFIIENVNAFIDTINNGSEFLEDTDNFYLGSTSIPAGNYTLTLGALKKILTVYDKEVIGGTVVKNPLNTDKAILFPSLEISKDNGIIQVMQTEIDKPSQADIEANPEVGKVVGYDTDSSSITNQNNVVNVTVDSITETSSEMSISTPSNAICNEASLDSYLNGVYTFNNPTIHADSNTMEIEFTSLQLPCFADYVNVNFPTVRAVTNETIRNVSAKIDSIQINSYITTSGIITKEITANIINPEQGAIVENSLVLVRDDAFTLRIGRYGITEPFTIVSININWSYELNEGETISGTSLLMPSISFNTLSNTYLVCNKETSSHTEVLPGGQTNPDIIKIADIDWNRDEWVMNTTDDWLYVNPEQSPLISLTVQNPPRGSAVNPDNTKPQFIVPRRYGTYAGERGDYVGGLVRLANGSNIIDNNFVNYSKSRNRAIDFVFAPVWVPQGMASTIFPVYGCSIAQYYTLS